MCGCVATLKEDFSDIFVRSNSPEKLLQGFKSSNVHIWVNGLTIQHNVYQNQPFCIPKTVAMTFQLNGVTSEGTNFDLHRSILNLHKNYLPTTILSSDFNVFIWQIYTLVKTVNILGIPICNPAFLELILKKAWWWPLKTETCSLAPVKHDVLDVKLLVILIINGVAFNFFFQGEVEWCHSNDCLLSGVQSDGFMFLPLRWSVTISFHHHPYNRGGNLKTSLSTQLCGSLKNFVKTNNHTKLHSSSKQDIQN